MILIESQFGFKFSFHFAICAPPSPGRISSKCLRISENDVDAFPIKSKTNVVRLIWRRLVKPITDIHSFRMSKRFYEI